MNARLINIMTVVVAAGALITTATIVFRDPSKAAASKAAATRRPLDVANWRDLAGTGLRTGPARAAVVITQFSDFQCPYCGKLFVVLTKIAKKYPGDVALVYRHFPIDRIHPHARAAALAAECAERFGRFQPVHDFLYSHQDSIGKIPWAAVAFRAGVAARDTVGFIKCMGESTTRARLTVDSIAARGIGLTGTPTVLVNNWKLKGTPSFEVVDSLVQRLLKARKR